MPVWVANRLEISGPEAELERFRDECFTMEAEGPRLNFDKLIPMPDAIRSSTDGGGMEADGSFRFPDWYIWNCEHWGTKWNACNTRLTITGNGSKVIKLHFDTAWAPPWPIYEELAERFPSLTIEGHLLAESMEFGGRIRCQNGKIGYEDKTEQIEAKMAEVCAEIERERATTTNNLVPGADDDVPF
jgi:Ferredoxin-like domain in Api92-like protein